MTSHNKEREQEWKDIPLLFMDTNQSAQRLPKPEELDEETEKSCLGALSHLQYDEPSTIEKIENWKEKGNGLFQKRKYIQAIQCYTEALKEWDKTNRNDVDGGCESWIACVLYSNRAAAQLALKNYGKALEDCKQSLKLGCFEKSYYRGCIAALAMNKWKEAETLLRQAKEKHALDHKTIARLEEKAKAQRTKEERKWQVMQQKQQQLRLQIKVVVDALEQRKIRLGLPLYVSQKYKPKDFIPQVCSSSSSAAEEEEQPPRQQGMSWPVLFVYPLHEQSDLVENCHEDVSLDQLLSMLWEKQPPWDDHGIYKKEQVEVFYYTQWTRCLEDVKFAVEYLYFHCHGDVDTCQHVDMGEKIVLSSRSCSQQTLLEIISRKDYVVPLYPVLMMVPRKGTRGGVEGGTMGE